MRGQDAHLADLCGAGGELVDLGHELVVRLLIDDLDLLLRAYTCRLDARSVLETDGIIGWEVRARWEPGHTHVPADDSTCSSH